MNALYEGGFRNGFFLFSNVVAELNEQQSEELETEGDKGRAKYIATPSFDPLRRHICKAVYILVTHLLKLKTK